jgi:hypothetical protein
MTVIRYSKTPSTKVSSSGALQNMGLDILTHYKPGNIGTD